MEYHKISSATFSKKLTNSHSFGGASIYDGVFGGCPMKVGSRVEEDFGAIFGGSSSSSIPVLDVPELNERKICVDVKSSKLDYSKIFGGFGEFDFALSYEELSAESRTRHSLVIEARTAAETGLHPSTVSAENQLSSQADDSCQSVNGAKQLRMSYHKANQERKNGTNGTTHVTQLHAVRGYSCLIDEFAPSRVTEGGGKPFSSDVNGIRLNTNFSGEMLQGKHKRKTSSVHSPGGSSKQASRDGVKFQNEYNHSRSYSNDVLFDACEIGLRTRASKVPVPLSKSDSLGNSKGDSKTSVDSKFGVFNGHSSEDATGFCSPTYFDEELDANSVAAISAAAVKKAIEEAQARIRIAKEIMERKKDGLQNHVKPKFKKGPKAEESREGKITIEVREEARQKYEKGDAPMQDFAGLGTENAMKAEQAAPDRERDGLFSLKEASSETQGYKNDVNLMDHSQEEMKDLKEEKWGGIGAKLVQSVNDILKERIFTMKMFEKPEEDAEKLKAVEEAQEQEDVERKLNALQGACELKEGACERKSDEGADDQEEYGQKSTVAGLQEEQDMTFKASNDVEAREKKQRRLWDLTASNYKLEMQLKDNEHELKEGACEPMSDQGVHDQEEYGKESKIAGLQEEKEVKASHNVVAREKKQRRLWDLTANEYKPEMQLKENEWTKMKKPKDEQLWLENEKKQREVLEQKETDIRSEDFSETEEDEVAPKEIFENGKTDESTCERVQFEKQQKACRWEENEEGLEDVHGREDAENSSDGAQEQENVEVTINEFHDGEQNEKKLFADIESGAEGRVLEAEENEQMLKKAYQMKEIDKRLEESCEWAETEEMQREIDQREEDEKMKVNEEACNFRNNLEVANDVCEEDKTEILHETLKASVHDDNNEYLKVPTHEENQEVVEVIRASSECKEMETESNDQEENRIFEFKIAGLAQVFLEHTEIQKQVEDTTPQFSERNGLNIGVSDANARQKQSDQLPKESKMVFNAENFDEETCESEEKFEDVEEVEAAIEQGEDERNSEFFHDERWVYNGENMKATQLPCMFQGKGESTEIADHIKTSQNTEREQNHSETLKIEGREVEGTMQNEVELQKQQARKTDGEKEKVREKEKERIAVERAIREARERAFTEARERAERAAVEKANAEACRRAMAGARERLEKACTEVSDKSSADKTSMEARLKAERAAVERATAEARSRALEKAMSEKSTSKDSHYKGSGRNRSTAYSNSSSHEVPQSTNTFDGANGESVQRDRARLESHQRIAERAAKALAEKNKRDLLAQKEQAERNRLAEALDVEVKRWSSGKTGNLRAMLSSLQYILGPDSGWQPIPLTELIATGAVKKAYRKATLCVHPDKLQQRGASIQHKYTCEKVFDLLKEAWNKFNAEER